MDVACVRTYDENVNRFIGRFDGASGFPFVGINSRTTAANDEFQDKNS